MYKIILILILLFFISCSNNVESEKMGLDQKIKKFISTEELEKAGFEHITKDFVLFFLKDKFFLLNGKDHLIVKYNSEKKALKSYQEEGQGPGGMINPFQMMLYNPDTLAVFDSMKRNILLFDLQLNYKNEIKVTAGIRKLQKNKTGFIAFGDFEKKIFARLDSNLKILDTFLTPDRTVPFKDTFPGFLNIGYLLRNGKIVHTSWVYLRETCRADIYDLSRKEKIISLKWKHPYPPTQKSISSKTNMYGSNHVGEFGDFYILFNSSAKTLTSPQRHELLVFRKNGDFHAKHFFPYEHIRSNSPEKDSRIFFLDDEAGIIYLDAQDL